MILALLIACSARADLLPIPNQSLQLQQLIEKSQQQIDEAKKLVENSKADVRASEQAAHVLDQLSRGLDRSIEQFKGTRAYERALLELQSQRTADRAKDESKDPREREKKNAETFDQFQQQTLEANRNDLADQEKLEQALHTAEPGFVPKIQTRAQLGSWQAGTRTSAQLSELLIAVRQLSDEVRAQKSGGPASLLRGSEDLNKQMRGVSNAPR